VDILYEKLVNDGELQLVTHSYEYDLVMRKYGDGEAVVCSFKERDSFDDKEWREWHSDSGMDDPRTLIVAILSEDESGAPPVPPITYSAKKNYINMKVGNMICGRAIRY
jgi:hypothetical protein